MKSVKCDIKIKYFYMYPFQYILQDNREHNVNGFYQGLRLRISISHISIRVIVTEMNSPVKMV